MADNPSHFTNNPMGGGPSINTPPPPPPAAAAAADIDIESGGTAAEGAPPHVTENAKAELTRQGITDQPKSWEKRNSTVKGPEHYRRPTVALNRMQAEVARREAEDHENEGNTTFAHRVETAYQHRLANGLQRARAQGYVSDSTVVDVATMNSDGSNPFAVCNQDISVQLGFRRKLLGLLLLNLLTVLGLMFAITCTPVIFDYVKDESWITGVGFFVWGYSLVMMFMCKDKYPWNYVCLFFFTIGFAVFFGAGQRAFLSYSNFQIVGNACVTNFLLIIISTNKWPCATKKGRMQGVLAQRTSALIAWFICLIAGIVVQAVYMWPVRGAEWGHFVSCQIFSALATWYFAYDTYQIEQRLTVDDYMLGVINFYTDFLMIVVCCCCAAVLMGGD